LNQVFEKNEVDYSYATFFNDPKNFRDAALEETRPFREYMVKESIQ